MTAPSSPAVAVRTRLAWYAATATLTLILAGVGYRLDVHDLRVPLLYHDPVGVETDSLLILPMVQSTLERGGHWRNDRLGAPGVQEMSDFPVVDHFHFLGIWLLGRFTNDAFLVFNLYYLLTYPLTALTTMAALRHFALGFRPAAVGGVLYALAPYHLFRGENHYFLSAYFIVPITCVIVLWLCEGRLPFFPAAANRKFRWRDRDTLVAVLIAAVTASSGAYYAFFACILLMSAGVYGWVIQKTWRAFASAVLVTGVVVAGGVVNHAPQFVYQAQYGKHTAPTQRYPEEAEYYGMKLAQLVLPIEDHTLEPLANLKATWNSIDRPVQSWTERYSLGTIAAVGLIALLCRMVLPLPRRWPYSPLAAMTAAGVLVGTIGGFGAMFNHIISPQVRCYNRLAVYISFFCLFAVLSAIEQWVNRCEGTVRHGKWLAGGVWIALGWFGVWDQTPYYWGGPKMVARHQYQAERFAEDAAFFAQVEELLNAEGASPGPMVFQLPYVKWPESPTVHQLYCYEHARGSMHTRTLRWSFGSMKGRETDEWYRKVSVLPAEQMLTRAAKAGFEGLFLDKRGYSPKVAEDLHRAITASSQGAEQIVHPDGKQIFIDLRPFRQWLYGQLKSTWDAECDRERKGLSLLWLHGFDSFKEPGYEWQHRWCGKEGLLVMVNPSSEPKTFSARFYLRTTTRDPTTLSIRGGDLWTEDLEINDQTDVQARTFTVPPGRHMVHFRCPPPVSHAPTNPRNLYWFVSGLKAE